MKTNKLLIILIIFLIKISFIHAEKIDLSGKWQVALDSTDVGINQSWFNKTFEQTISLPGTLCDAGLGKPCLLKPAMEKDIFLNLKRKYDYVGVAWYKKEVEIPTKWKNKSIYLELERVIWNSQLWIDGKKVDQSNESLIAPHSFDLSKYMSPGKHTISLRIDNRKQHDISIRDMAHAYTNETQTMWNGVLGEITLQAFDNVHLTDLRIDPDPDQEKIYVTIRLKRPEEKAPEGNIRFEVKDAAGKKLPAIELPVKGNEISFDYAIKNPILWDEFTPYLYQASVQLKIGNKEVEKKTETFGIRKLSTDNGQLQINHRRIFLRGTLECCIFPLKGYPPTAVEAWEKVFKSAREYGLNHLRFHSWCPPEAAFEVADRMGFYLQVELPLWVLNVGNDKGTTNFLCEEAQRMISEYGNHPSFCFWSLGNELEGDYALLDSLLVSLEKQDPRHLYMTTTFTFQKGHGAWPEPHDDLWVSQWTKKGWIRGQGIFDDKPASFNLDYRNAIDSLPVPIITHEIGQYSVFPNLKEIDKYTGNLIPLNFMSVKNDLQNKGRLNQADDYLKASGKLAVILYKEEIERALKTPGFSGFQLLDLHDFPGQGTALVGLLDAFWESKGLIDPATFRSFCSPVVPLIRFPKATYTTNEIFKANVEVANFSAGILKNANLNWQLLNADGKEMLNGNLPQQDIPVGNAQNLGDFTIDLSTIKEAGKYTISLSITQPQCVNTWDIWVYPANLNETMGNIVYTQDFEEANKALKMGKNVLLNPKKENLNGLDGKFVQVFWSPVHFPNQPGTMGILCDPKHPALEQFPTEMHSNWQWWDICKSGKTMNLDTLSNEIQPIVRMVDNFYKNRNLGLIIEVKSEKGKLLICSADLNSNLKTRPVARQLRYSLLHYMNSVNFNPQQTISFDLIEKRLHKTKQTEEKKKSIYDN